MESVLLKETYYLDVKIVNSPSDFIACIGKCTDYTEFNKFISKLNTWCNQKCAFNLNKSSSVHINALRTNDPVLVKYSKSSDLEELLWRRAKIHSIDYNK
jgi:hypothetical protein